MRPLVVCLAAAFVALVVAVGSHSANQFAGQPLFLTGTYDVVVAGAGRVYPSTWRVKVTSGGQVTGSSKWTCCPGARTDSLSGAIEAGRVKIARNCAGQGAPPGCVQNYSFAELENGDFYGVFVGTGALPGYKVTMKPHPESFQEVGANGCGGGWGVGAQNFLGDISYYQDSLNPIEQFKVDFRYACNIHDAGYGGDVVRDVLQKKTINFRRWSRRMVDDLFLKETRILCEQQIGAGATVALQKCLGTGGTGSIGAVSRYNIVRRLGDDRFDADLRMPGVQRAGHRLNN